MLTRMNLTDVLLNCVFVCQPDEEGGTLINTSVHAGVHTHTRTEGRFIGDGGGPS